MHLDWVEFFLCWKRLRKLFGILKTDWRKYKNVRTVTAAWLRKIPPSPLSELSMLLLTSRFVRSSFNCAFFRFCLALDKQSRDTPLSTATIRCWSEGNASRPSSALAAQILVHWGRKHRGMVVCIMVGAFYCKEALSNQPNFPSSNSWRKRVSWIQKWRPKLS